MAEPEEEYSYDDICPICEIDPIDEEFGCGRCYACS